MTRAIRVLPVCVLALLTGCASGPYHNPGSDRYQLSQDTGPNRVVDVSKLPEPVPTPEPRARYGNTSPYVVNGKKYYIMPTARGYSETGIASWYGSKFNGYRTSSGEIYDMYKFTAAHKTLPLPTWARVTNLDNGRSVIVKINDRGPFHKGRIIDLSWAAAKRLGIAAHGTGRVRVDAIIPGEKAPGAVRQADAGPATGTATGSTADATTYSTTTATTGATAQVVRPAAIPSPPPTPVASTTADTSAPGTSPTTSPTRAPDTAPDTASASAATAATGLYLQAGAFHDPGGANALKQRLQNALTYPVSIHNGTLSGQPVYKVWLGPFKAEAQRQAAARAVSEAGFPDPVRVLP